MHFFQKNKIIADHMLNPLLAKPWQLFLLNVGIPLVLSTFATFAFLPSNATLYLITLNTGAVISILIFLYWILNIGIRLRNKLPGGIHLNLAAFLLSVSFIPFAFAVSFYITFHIDPISINQNLIFGIIWSISFISFLYSVYFVSKEIKTIELNRNCSIRECILEIVLILAFPIGIWIIQPRITKIYKEHPAVQ